MSADRPEVCARAQQLSSAFLDGRLDAPRRSALQRHLRGCPACLRVVRQDARLSRATHNLPPHRAANNLAARVRSALGDRRRERLTRLDDGVGRRAAARAALWTGAGAAAAALLTLTWWLGYWMGGARLAPTSPDAALAPAPAAGAPSTQRARSGPPSGTLHARGPAAETGDATFAAHSRRVLSDLAWAGELPEPARRPLIASQLELFDLRDRAERVRRLATERTAERELAELVLELARTFDADDEPDWGALRDRQPAPVAPDAPDVVLADHPPELVPVEQVVRRHGEGLGDRERRELGRFLELKRELVTGARTPAGDVVRSFRASASFEAHGSVATSFSVATGFATARTLVEEGRPADAAELEQIVRDMLREMTQQLER